MAKLVYERSRKRLRKLLATAHDRDLLEAAWLIDWGRSPDFKIPATFHYPNEFVKAKINERGRIQSWELETLLTEALSIEKHSSSRMAATKEWAYISEAINALRSAENAEGGLNDESFILNEMNRILYRQLPWQVGNHEPAEIIRWQSFFSNDKLAAMFAAHRGTSAKKFVWIGALALHMFRTSSTIAPFKTSPTFAVSQADIDSFFNAVSGTPDHFRSKARTIVASSGLQYRESPFRQCPLVKMETDNGPRYFCPLRLPLLWRITTGLYYDVIGEDEARNLLGLEFEKYERRLLAASFPKLQVAGDEAYGSKGAKRKTPDIIVSDNGALLLAFECKAKRVPLTEKIDLFSSARSSLARAEIAKGVFQLVRFRMDLRSGLIDGLKEVPGKSRFVVLALDDWMFTGSVVKDDVFRGAEALVSRAGFKPDFDIREISFCTAAELDIFVAQLALDEMIDVFAKNASREYREYSPLPLAQPMLKGAKKWKDFPLADELLPTELIE